MGFCLSGTLSSGILYKWDFVSVGFCRVGFCLNGILSSEILCEWDFVAGKLSCGKLTSGKMSWNPNDLLSGLAWTTFIA